MKKSYYQINLQINPWYTKKVWTWLYGGDLYTEPHWYYNTKREAVFHALQYSNGTYPQKGKILK